MQRPRWSEDKLAYARLLRLQGYRGAELKRMLYAMERKETHSLGLLASEAVSPRLKESDGVDIDMDWVSGSTCSEMFENLTFEERWFLFLLYHGDLPSSPSKHKYLSTIRKRLRSCREG